MKMPEKERKKPKKEKIVYIDDGSTVADMSNLDESRRLLFKKKDPDERQRPKVIEHFKTYFQSVKVMILPMLVVIGLISVVFLLLWLLMGGFQSLF